jgi:hypothetical protein
MSALLTHHVYLVDLPLLIVLTSLVYSATRHDRWPAILFEAVRWGVRLGAFLLGIVVLLFVVDRI